jgi:hypothetical protein
VIKSRRLEVTMIFLVLLASASSRCFAQCTSGSSIHQWRCWEQTISSSVDFYGAGAGNPYRDLTLRVTFTSGATTFTQDTFWLGDTLNPKSFKVRAALPPGTWTWQVAGCTGTTGGQSCASGVTWTPSSGTITVSTDTTGPQLYARGFPTQNCTWSKSLPPTLIGCSPLVYGDKVNPFFWAGDTAWSAPAVEINAQLHGGTQYWSQYLATRTPIVPSPGSYHFTVILIAPADDYNVSNAPDVFFSQSPCTVTPGQTNTFPNNCSIPQPAYWNYFDNLVSQANQQDLFIMIAGLMHPFDTHPYSTYPALNSVTRFSRYVAARMAGYATMFSPGFDMPVNGTAVDGSSLRAIMDASGNAVQAASPRALITNHLNGQATCTDYQSFAAESPSPSPWMTTYLFQSGHANQTNGVAGTTCPGYLSSDGTPVFAAMRRAITMPITLAPSSPSLPTINGEGPYDDLANDNPPAYSQVNMQYRVRQAGNLSSLSNAQGFTYGVNQLGTWTSPSSYWGLPSAGDMQKLAERFKSNPGMPSHPEWIVNNPTAYDQQQAIASNGSTVAIAYVPPLDPARLPTNISITLDTLKPAFPVGVGCPGTGSPWTLTWETPTTNATQPVLSSKCSLASGKITLQSPDCGTSNASIECDWILLMSKTGGPAVPSAQTVSLALAPASRKLTVWRDLSSGDGTSAIFAQIEGATTLAPIEVSPSGLAFQDGARVASVPNGYVVVWHAEGLDGSLLGVFGQRVDTQGNLAGSMFRINSTTVSDQRDPVIAADPAGNTVVVWSSYGQDGDFGGIYGQIFDARGKPVGSEFQINSVTAGHQTWPQATYLPRGGFVVGWTTQPIGPDPGALSFRLFNSNGSPVTSETRISGNALFHPELVDLEPDTISGFSVRWLLRDNTRATIASYQQQFMAQGSASGALVVLP